MIDLKLDCDGIDENPSSSPSHMICPEGHVVPYARYNFAVDFSDGGRDAMTLEPLFESGLYCWDCERGYGLSKLREPLTE